ncbi:hypothetical protein AMS68_001877 [Peltaster fructicola]|uniref:Uncharacterized protein n=1 Tax=Peltaster fructicola TaxID=286661 RepID=A0A6H0XPF2_9PEZI|nr:hypothetical protein AMS68_001877 [Peltaster fructicola]
MSSGQQAAEETKGALKGAYVATEDARKNVNSFFDNVIGDNKTHSSTGFSQDAKAVGNEINKGIDNASTNTGSTGQTHSTQ